MTRSRPALGVIAALAVLAGCGTMKNAGDAMFGGDEQLPGLEAPLRPLPGSALQGSVRFVSRHGGVMMLVSLNGLPPGQYRVMVHANGNCSSPNAFSAGPPWYGASGSPMIDRVPLVTTNTEGTAIATFRLAGVTLEQGPNALRGRSVVVHDGAGASLDAQPDVRNARIACGLIGPLNTFF